MTLMKLLDLAFVKLTILSDQRGQDLIEYALMAGFVENIRKTKGLEHTPIVVLSGSVNPEDVHNVYRLGGNCFIHKPMQLDEFIHCMTTCYEFWCNVAGLPHV